jgi:uncharacterized membrane protein YhaH (DUF805 family)
MQRELNRLKFFLLWVSITLIVYLPVYILNKNGSEIPASGLLTLSSVVDFIYTILCLPLFVMRLRNLQWPIVLSLFFVLGSILQIKNFVLVGISLSQTLMILIWVLNVLCLLLFSVLLLKKGKYIGIKTIQP